MRKSVNLAASREDLPPIDEDGPAAMNDPEPMMSENAYETLEKLADENKEM